MCTAASFSVLSDLSNTSDLSGDFYFGRNLDYEFSYGEEIVITPRNYPFTRRVGGESFGGRFALCGMAHVAENYPLYYDAVNECGLCMAGLNFAVSTSYRKEKSSDAENIAPFEFIPWVLSQCRNISEARELIKRTSLIDIPFGEGYPQSMLHWIVADKDGCITVESVSDGIHVYENPVGVLTNEPSFDIQLFNLNNYMSLSSVSPENSFSNGLPLRTYSRGMGAMGLPGDLSSMSRFVRASFARENMMSDGTEEGNVGKLFHILASVWQQKGLCCVGDGKYEYTIYSSCVNAAKGIYYYKTYDSHGIRYVDMRRERLDGCELIKYPMISDAVLIAEN